MILSVPIFRGTNNANQLLQIMGILGTPLKYKKKYPHYPKTSLREFFPNASREGIELTSVLSQS
jgi:hypothetical protein